MTIIVSNFFIILVIVVVGLKSYTELGVDIPVVHLHVRIVVVIGETVYLSIDIHKEILGIIGNTGASVDIQFPAGLLDFLTRLPQFDIILPG
jgi:hypothetical protein